MIRIDEFRSAALRTAAIAGFALLLAMPAPAAAQATTAPQQEDMLKFRSASPAIILFQINADKTADFEAGWAAIKAGFAKVTDADAKAFGATLDKLYKLDQPPMDTPTGKVAVYVLQIDAPSTTFSYNPVEIIYKVLWKNAEGKEMEGSPLKREEADAIYNKFKDKVFQSINPWKLTKVG